MKKFIVMICITLSPFAFSQEKEKKVEEKKEVKEKKKPNMGLKEQSKSERTAPWNYNGLILNLSGGLGLGYADQSFTGVNHTSTGDTDALLIELSGNAQGGWMVKGFYIAGDFRVDYGSHEEMKYDGLASITNKDTATSVGFGLGAVVGYEFNFGFKFFAGFSPLETLSLASKAGASTNYDGKGFKFGLDYLTDRGIGFGIQYISVTYDEREGKKFPQVLTEGTKTFRVTDYEVGKVVLYMHFPMQLSK
ncbi:MAG: hypothetical protein CME70_23250 [Halobacteriovorax sp.]|nr:hypothetical protein [Halobacteriovorax sp.]